MAARPPDPAKTHKHAKVRDWAAGNDIERVFLPTYCF